MFVSNNPECRFDQENKSGWNLLPSLMTKKGVKILGVGKKDLPKFYLKYLKFKPDIIVLGWVPACCIPPFFKKLKLVKCPLVLNWDDYYADMMTNYPRPLVKFMEDFTVKNVDYITTVSKINQKKAKAARKPVFYVPHGYFDKPIKTRVNLDKLKTKKNNVKIIYLGEQIKFKKIDQIINAVKGMDCDLFLFGTPNPEFVKMAGKNVHFQGYLPELEVRAVLKQADILVNPSDQDCSYKFFEYLSVEKPILAYDGLPNLLLTNGVNAYLTKDFKKGLIELIKNKELRRRLEKNTKKFKTFSWDYLSSKYIELYWQMVLNSKDPKKHPITWKLEEEPSINIPLK